MYRYCNYVGTMLILFSPNDLALIEVVYPQGLRIIKQCRILIIERFRDSQRWALCSGHASYFSIDATFPKLGTDAGAFLWP